MKKLIFVSVIGASAVGKDYFINELCKTKPKIFHKPKNYTDREIREEEAGNPQHCHVTKDTMVSLMKQLTPVAPGTFGGDTYCMFLEDLAPNRVNIKAMSPIGALVIDNLFPDIIDHFKILVRCNKHLSVKRLISKILEKDPGISPVDFANKLAALEKRLARNTTEFDYFVNTQEIAFYIDTDEAKEYETDKQTVITAFAHLLKKGAE